MLLPDIQTGDIYLGTDEVEKMYIGDVEVWPCPGGCVEYSYCGCIKPFVRLDQYTATFLPLPVFVTPTLKWRFVGSFLKNVGSTHLGAYNLPDSNDYRLFMQQRGGYTFLDMGSGRMSANNGQTPWSAGTDADLTVANYTLTDNYTGNVILSGNTQTVPTGARFQANVGMLRINELLVWETSGGTDELIFDGVPKIRIEDDQPGLYDTVSKEFLTTTAVTFETCLTPEMLASADTLTYTIYKDGNVLDEPLSYLFYPQPITGQSAYPSPYIYFRTADGISEPYSNGNHKMKFKEPLTEISTTFYFGYGESKQVDITYIPDTVLYMPYAFYGNYSLIHCYIPKGVRDLRYTFRGCINLLDADVPEGVTHLVHTFFDCQSLTALTLPSTLTYVDNALNGSEWLEEITFNGTQAQWQAITNVSQIRPAQGNLTRLARIVCSDGTITF